MSYQRKTMPIEEHKTKVRVIIGLGVLFFVVFMYLLGMVTRDNILIWPISEEDRIEGIRFVEQVKAVEVEKPIYVTPETIEDKIRATFTEDPETAVRVAKCESGLNPKAKNKTSSARGLFQIMQSWHKVSEKWLLNEDINIAIAHQLWHEQGWVPWEASRHCWGE